MQYYYTYILYSPLSKEFYTSFTKNLKGEMQLHNDGHISKTAKGTPWNLIWYSAFRTEQSAIEFENFLKTADGKRFMGKWLIPFNSEEIPESIERPANAKTCPICEGSGKAANDSYFNKFGHRQAGKPEVCLNCVGKGWID